MNEVSLKLAVVTGQLCKLYDHKWETTLGEGEMSDPKSGEVVKIKEMKVCDYCGKRQVLLPARWEDV